MDKTILATRLRKHEQIGARGIRRASAAWLTCARRECADDSHWPRRRPDSGLLVAPTPTGFRVITVRIAVLPFDQGFVAVMPPVANELYNLRAGRPVPFTLLGRYDNCSNNGRRVAVVSHVHNKPHAAPREQVHRLLNRVRQIRAPVLHLQMLSVLVVRMGSAVIVIRLLPEPPEAGQLGERRRDHPGERLKPPEKCPAAVARVPPHSAAQRGNRIERRNIEPDTPARHEAVFDKWSPVASELSLARIAPSNGPNTESTDPVLFRAEQSLGAHR